MKKTVLFQFIVLFTLLISACKKENDVNKVILESRLVHKWNWELYEETTFPDSGQPTFESVALQAGAYIEFQANGYVVADDAISPFVTFQWFKIDEQNFALVDPNLKVDIVTLDENKLEFYYEIPYQGGKYVDHYILTR